MPCNAARRGSLRRGAGEAGTGIISSVFAVGVFLSLVLLAAQVSLLLYARSTVSAAAFQAVSEATSAGSAGNLAAAEARGNLLMNQLLGSYARNATYDWHSTRSDVSLTVRLSLPSLLPRFVVSPLGLETVRREAVLLRERIANTAGQPGPGA